MLLRRSLALLVATAMMTFGFDITGPSTRDFAVFLDTGGEEFFRGAWRWYSVVVVQLIFYSVLGEDLLFRGLLLPRMRGVFGGPISSPTGRPDRVLPSAHPVVDPRLPGGHHPYLILPISQLRFLRAQRKSHRSSQRTHPDH
jgi:hypothetical protein